PLLPPRPLLADVNPSLPGSHWQATLFTAILTASCPAIKSVPALSCRILSLSKQPHHHPYLFGPSFVTPYRPSVTLLFGNSNPYRPVRPCLSLHGRVSRICHRHKHRSHNPPNLKRISRAQNPK